MQSQAVSASSPQVDLTTVNAVQSLFSGDYIDPWALSAAEDFVDFVLWNDSFRYPVLLIAGNESRESSLVKPSLLEDLNRREAGLATPHVRIINERPLLRSELFEQAWRTFAAFVRNNQQRVHGFLAMHASSWIRDQIISRFPDSNQYIFDVAALRAHPEIEKFRLRTKLDDSQIAYLFDLALKYLLYAEQADGKYYLSHPIRARLEYRSLDKVVAAYEVPSRRIPFRLGPYLVKAAAKKDCDWFASRLHEARAFVRDSEMMELSAPGAVSKEELRRLAIRLGLPATFRHHKAVDNIAAISSAAAGVAGSLVTTNPLPAIAGAGLSVVTKLWAGGVTGSAAQAKWLQWMLEWPIERESGSSD